MKIAAVTDNAKTMTDEIRSREEAIQRAGVLAQQGYH
jgi:hypothetical protein